MKRRLEELALHFDAMAEDYDLAPGAWLKRSQAKVAELARPQPDDYAIDIGTGTGWVALELAKKVKEVLALDISPKMLEKAAQKINAARIKNVAIEHGSFQELARKAERLRGRATLIVSNFAMHHLDLDEKRRSIEEMADLLAPAGRVVLGDIMFFEDPAKHADMFDPEVDDPSWARDLEASFRKAGFAVTTFKLHPVVGVIRAERTVQEI